MRSLCVTALIAAAALAGCGGDDQPKAAAGTPENPLIATHVGSGSSASSNESQPKPADQPGYDTLLDRQKQSSSTSRFTPCNLVTRSQARSILGDGVQAPVEAPQGPTCIYRSETGKTFITLAVQSLDIDKLRRQVRRSQTVAVSDRKAYCGVYGTSMLYLPLRDQRVLSVAAPCAVAKRFAARAVASLEG